MTVFRSLRWLAALFLGASLITPAAQAQSKGELRIGFQKGASLLLLQKAQGSLEKKLAPLGVGVKWVEFPAGPQLLEGLNVGAVDLGCVGEAPPIFAQAAGARFYYIGHDPAAPRAEALVVPKDSPVRSAADLKGKKVALNKGSNVHYLLVRLLEKNGLKLAVLAPVYLPPADARAAFESKNVAAGVLAIRLRNGVCRRLGDLGALHTLLRKADRRLRAVWKYKAGLFIGV